MDLPKPEVATKMPLGNLGRNAARMVASAVGGLVVSVLTARSLGAERMGGYAYVLWVATMVAGLSAFGLPDAIARYVAEHKSNGANDVAARIARKILGIQVAIATLAAGLAALIWCLWAQHGILVILLALSTVLPMALMQALLALMEGEQRFDLQLRATIAGSLFQVAITAVCFARHESLAGFLVGNLISSAVATGIAFAMCRPLLGSSDPAGPVVETAELRRRIRNFSLSVYGLSLLSLVVWDRSEMVFLRWFRSPSEVAFYSIAFALTARLSSAGDSFGFVLFPLFVARYTQRGASGLAQIYRASMRFIQLIMAPAFLWGIPLAPRLVLLIYGPQYAQVGRVAQVLLAMLFFAMTITVSTGAIYAVERQGLFLRIMVFVAAFNIALDLLLIPRYGAPGAAFAKCIAQTVAACALLLLVRRFLPGGFPVIETLKIYFAAAISTLPIVYASLILRAGIAAVLLSVVIAAAVYLGVLVLLHVIGRGDAGTSGERIAFWRATEPGGQA